jgi:hypothetical protein
VPFLLFETMPFDLDEELRKRAQEWAEKTAVEQGLPPKVTDHAVLREIARLLELELSDATAPKLK